MNEYIAHYKDKIVLVTGGAGAIGSSLTAALAAAETKKIIILDDFSSAYRWNIPKASNVICIEGSVLDDETLKEVFSTKPTIVFHLAAFFAKQNSVEHPLQDLQVNGIGTLKVLQYAQIVGAQRIVYASSEGSFYGKDTPIPMKEKDGGIVPHTPYQITKLLGELYCDYFNFYYGVSNVNVRFFNSYGPGEIPGRYRNVIPNFFYWALKREPLPITGTGHETRDFTFVEDIVDGLLRAGVVLEANGEAINLGTGHQTEILELATMINELTNNPAGMTFNERRSWDVHHKRQASIKKAKKLLGYKPTTELRDGLEKTLDWFKENWVKIEAVARF